MLPYGAVHSLDQFPLQPLLLLLLLQWHLLVFLSSCRCAAVAQVVSCTKRQYQGEGTCNHVMGNAGWIGFEMCHLVQGEAEVRRSV